MRYYSDKEILSEWNSFFNGTDGLGHLEYLNENLCDSLNLWFRELCQYDEVFASYVLYKPEKCLKLGERVIMNNLPERDPSDRVRLTMYGLLPESHVTPDGLRMKHLGTAVALEGVIKDISLPKVRMEVAHFTCDSCGMDIWTVQNGKDLTEPHFCPGTGCGSGSRGSGPLSHHDFSLDYRDSVYSDFRIIEIGEADTEQSRGTHPKTMTGYYCGELDSKGILGKKVIINGIVRPMNVPSYKASVIFDFGLDILSIENKKKSSE